MRKITLISVTIFVLMLCTSLWACKRRQNSGELSNATTEEVVLKDYVPESGSFEEYLMNFPRKESNVVHDWQGHVIKNNSLGVLDISVGEYQQCADAVIRLWAEYLYSKKQYDKIQFKLTSGLNVPFEKWANGYRVRVKGNNATLVKSVEETGNYSRKNFDAYLRIIMIYAGTASLARDLPVVNHNNEDDLKVGDVLVLGGFPGHAVIIIDKKYYGKTPVYLFAQSWMPAQDIEILGGYVSGVESDLLDAVAPYIPIPTDDDVKIVVSGYTFEKQSIRRFE